MGASMGLYPNLGFGLGLRVDHYQHIVDQRPPVDWFEVITENYLVGGGKPKYFLHKIREHYPMVMHGVSMSIGSTDPLNFSYLAQVKELAAELQPSWISDHLCWTGVNQLNSHDLLPLPYTSEAVKNLVARINTVQDFLQRQILLENVSSYIEYSESQMTEWEFLAEVANESDCLILLDINNIYVSAFNHHFDPLAYIQAIPAHRVQQYHLAGHSQFPDYIIDTHDHPVIQDVWDLYQYAVKIIGQRSTMIERDDHIPPLADLLDELAMARKIATNPETSKTPQTLESKN